MFQDDLACGSELFESGKPDPAEIATNTFFSTQTRSEFGMTCGSAPVRKTAAHWCIAESCLSRLRDVKGGVKGCQIWGLPTVLLQLSIGVSIFGKLRLLYEQLATWRH
eukprot:s3612_g2.t1